MTKYFKIKIIKHTQTILGNKYTDCYHKDMVGKIILVKKTDWDGAYYECKTGESILKSDCELIKKLK